MSCVGGADNVEMFTSLETVPTSDAGDGVLPRPIFREMTCLNAESVLKKSAILGFLMLAVFAVENNDSRTALLLVQWISRIHN